MGYQDFISEHEATAITGMSKTTLSRFAEAGYLQLETDSDGLRMFSKGELANLFGIKETPQRERPRESSVKSSVRKEAHPHFVTPPPPATAPVEAVVEKPSPLVAAVEKVEANVTPQPVETAQQTAATQAPHLEFEVQRLKHLMQLQESILDLKDQQLKDLKEQRDWLQARVEKLEDKADRDQILLLTETQTIRSLVNAHQQLRRRSPMRLALEWLGVTAPDEESKNGSGTIDVATGMQKVRES